MGLSLTSDVTSVNSVKWCASETAAHCGPVLPSANRKHPGFVLHADTGTLEDKLHLLFHGV
jgi:hypothetical protein